MKRLYPYIQPFLLVLVVCLALQCQAFAFGCNPHGDQVSYGTNNKWMGYAYQGTGFNTYVGYVKEGNGSSPDFDEDFGGSQVNYKTNGCDIYTEEFSVRYKLTKSFSNGYYDFTVGGDDGYRLSIDGGNTWIIDRWVDQSYTTTTATVQLNGTYNLVLEYYERFGDNRVSFHVAAGCAPNGDPSVPGTGNVWRGYLYQGTNFQTYRGFITEGTGSNPAFDEIFGGPNVNFGTSSCGVQTENFSARFRLQMNLTPGSYTFVVGGDDGYRFSLDGGNTWVIDNWTAHSYTVSTYITNLSGNVNLVIEFFENGGDNRVSFAMSASAALPVKLTGFSAKAEAADKVQLHWNVSEEVNFSHYVVQRSTGGNDFADIGMVYGQEKDVHISTRYQYTDNLQYSGLVHYRLKMVDKDGHATYSSVVTVSLNVVQASAKIYPTVVEGGHIYVETNHNLPNGRVEIVDMSGRVLLSQMHTFSGRESISIGHLHIPAGTYMVRLTDGKQLVAGKMIMIR